MPNVIPYLVNHQADAGVILVVWPNLANGDTGVPYREVGSYGSKTVQVYGTPGAAGVATIYGSLWAQSEVSPQWFVMHDQSGGLLSIGVGGAEAQDQALQVYPAITGGDGTTSLSVRMMFSGAG